MRRQGLEPEPADEEKALDACVAGVRAGTLLQSGTDTAGPRRVLHVHDTDFVQFCFGRPKSVFSSGYSRFSKAQLIVFLRD